MENKVTIKIPKELDRVTEKTKELLAEDLDLLISVYTLLDRIQHFHWGEDCVLEWYRKLDDKIGKLLFGTQTLPLKTEQGELKGDHHENALLITVNLDYEIDRPQDVFYAIK